MENASVMQLQLKNCLLDVFLYAMLQQREDLVHSPAP